MILPRRSEEAKIFDFVIVRECNDRGNPYDFFIQCIGEKRAQIFINLKKLCATLRDFAFQKKMDSGLRRSDSACVEEIR